MLVSQQVAAQGPTTDLAKSTKQPRVLGVQREASHNMD